MLRPSPLAAVGLVVVATVLTGCDTEVGPDDDPPTTAQARASLVQTYAGADPTTAELAEGGCFADALLGRYDAQALLDAGVLADDGSAPPAVPQLTPELAQAWVDAQASCARYADVAARAAAERDDRVDPELYAACLDAALTPAQQRAALVRALTGEDDEPAVTRLTAAQLRCTTESR